MVLQRLNHFIARLRPHRLSWRLSDRQQELLDSLADGLHLKSHRKLDGSKFYYLHNQEGARVAPVEERDIVQLRRLDLIASNLKFPADTYILTDKGLLQAQSSARRYSAPITSVYFRRKS